MIFGLIVIIITTYILNLIIKFFFNFSTHRYHPLIIAINNHGNEIEQLCMQSMIDGFALQVTLKNEKVYIGYIDEVRAPGQTNYLVFIPMYSGYRDQETKKITLTTLYEPVFKSLVNDNLNDKLSIIQLIIKLDEILTISPHDPEVFQRFNNTADPS